MRNNNFFSFFIWGGGWGYFRTKKFRWKIATFFALRGAGGQKLFRNFPEIHPFLKRRASLTYNVKMKTANIDFYEVVSVKQITDFWLRVLCMNFLRQVKWGPHIEMGGTSFNGRRRALLHGNRFWEIPSTATAAYYCLNAGNRNGYNMQAMARMGILSMDDLNRQVVDEKRGN